MVKNNYLSVKLSDDEQDYIVALINSYEYKNAGQFIHDLIKQHKTNNLEYQLQLRKQVDENIKNIKNKESVHRKYLENLRKSDTTIIKMLGDSKRYIIGNRVNMKSFNWWIVSQQDRLEQLNISYKDYLLILKEEYNLK